MKRIGLLWLLSLALLLQGCMTKNPFWESTETTTGTTTEQTSSSTSEPIVRPTPNFTYRSAYANQVLGYLSAGVAYLRIMNKSLNQFGDATYVPQNLVTLDPNATLGNKEIMLEARAARALYAMLSEMESDGITSMRVTSGYRDYVRQSELYEDYKNKEMQTISKEAEQLLGYEYLYNKYYANGLTALDAQDAEIVANHYSAQPGTSEHQTGLCVDFMTLYMTALDESFADTDAFRWLSENAYRFGFILRYPSGKTDITGYIYEPWHYRYVGREAAADIHFDNLTLEEYVLG